MCAQWRLSRSLPAAKRVKSFAGPRNDFESTRTLKKKLKRGDHDAERNRRRNAWLLKQRRNRMGKKKKDSQASAINPRVYMLSGRIHVTLSNKTRPKTVKTRFEGKRDDSRRLWECCQKIRSPWADTQIQCLVRPRTECQRECFYFVSFFDAEKLDTFHRRFISMAIEYFSERIRSKAIEHSHLL